MGVLIHPTYFPSVAHWVLIAKQQHELVLEANDNYQKQTYRNRAYIYSPNGKQLLSIPIKHTKNTGHRKYTQVVLEDSSNWKKHHWKSIETSYRTSPYFEYYEDDIAPFFKKKHQHLFEMNLESMELLASCFQLDPLLFNQSKSYQITVEPGIKDMRSLVNAKTETSYGFDSYVQVFDEKHGFLENLSGLDLLFNEGPNALNYLLNSTLT